MCEYAEEENILFRFSPHFELLLAISKCVRMTLKIFHYTFVVLTKILIICDKL